MRLLSQHFVHDYHGQTTVHPLGLLMVLAMGIAILLVPRRYAIWPMIVIVCFVASAQRIVVAGADFTLLRIMIAFGTIRLLSRNEWHGIRWNALDAVVVIWGIVSLFMPLMRVGAEVFMNRLGHFYDLIGMYLLFRVIIRDWPDVHAAIRGLMWASILVACFVLVEWITRRNVFSMFGGVPEVTEVRDGRLRCQGAFAHPILAGCFFAAVLPLAAAMWWQNQRWRALALCSCLASLVIVLASASATPITAVVAAGIGATLFPFRYRMRWVRWGTAATLLVLHLMMVAPVWHLISRVSIVNGNSGWHRYVLVNGAIEHLDEWWMLGSSIGTDHWGHWAFDVTNMYIVQGLHGGLLQLGFFIGTIAVGFAQVGRLWRRVRSNRPMMIMAWALGISLWVHAINHFGVSYFGQIWMSWYLILAAISSMTSALLSKAASVAPEMSERVAHRRELVVTSYKEPVDGAFAGT